eukprot:9300868-Karenia_brevis.AAC.1
MLHAFEMLQANLALVASMPFGLDQVQYQVSECASTHGDDVFKDDNDQLQPAISACKDHID